MRDGESPTDLMKNNGSGHHSSTFLTSRIVSEDAHRDPEITSSAAIGRATRTSRSPAPAVLRTSTHGRTSTALDHTADSRHSTVGGQRAVPTTAQARAAQSVNAHDAPTKEVEKLPMKRDEVVKVPSRV